MKKIMIIMIALLFGFSSVQISEAQWINVVVSLTGKVLDSQTQEPVAVRLEAFDSDGNRIYYGRTKVENDGYYYITGLKPGSDYKLRFSDNKKYGEVEESVEIPEVDEYKEIEKDFHIEDKETQATPGK